MVYGVSQIALPSSDRSDSLRGHSLRGGDVPGFVVGHENRLAVPPLMRLLADDALTAASDLYNPLVLLGPTGTGKSHLARSITRHWRTLLGKTGSGESTVEYLTAIDFARQLRAAREEGQLVEFRDHLANLQLLVIEDLQRLPHRTFVQRELRDLLDTLIESEAVVVVTAQQPPATMAGLEAGLRDRLASGLTVRLQFPGVEARQELLRRSAETRGIPIDDKHLRLLAHNIEGSAPQLFRAIAEHQLAGTDQNSKDSTAEVAPLANVARPPLKLQQIIAVVARYFSLTQAAMRSATRRKSLVYARSVATHLARKLTDQSYAQIGQALGRRDHSTVMHANRTLEKKLANEASVQQDIEELKRILTAT